MKNYIEERAMAVASYIIEHNATVRQAAKQFGISKSTVHVDGTKWNGLCGQLNNFSGKNERTGFYIKSKRDRNTNMK